MKSAPSLQQGQVRRLVGTMRETLSAQAWVWSYLAVAAVWLAIGIIAGRGLGGTLESAIQVAPFLVLVATGQMFVITAGNGNIDLSVAYLMTLSAFVSVGVMNAGHGSFVLGILAGLLCGVIVAVINVTAILLLHIPPIVATLATGLIAQSAGLRYSSLYASMPDPSLASFTSVQVGGISVLAILCVGLALIVSMALRSTTYGRWLQAVGQNQRAAELSGINVTLVLIICYLLSGVLAATAGILLGAFVSPSLDLGNPYLMDSIASVVIGGTLIAGGRAFASGVWGGALFLILLVTLLNVMHINVAVQDVVKGVLIISVLALAGSGPARSA
jgi:ribose transport system permease protein